MVFAKEFKRPVNWWIAFMNESVQALLSCRHLACASSPKAEVVFGGSLAHDAKPDKSCVTAYIGRKN